MDGKKENREDWFGGLADKLRDHSESYKEGAWERFEAKHAVASPASKVRRMGSWKWSAAAAVVVLAGFFAIQRTFLGGEGEEEVLLTASPTAVEAPIIEPNSIESTSSKSVATEKVTELVDSRRTDATFAAETAASRITFILDQAEAVAVNATTELVGTAAEFPVQLLDTDFRPVADEYAWLNEDPAAWDVSKDSEANGMTDFQGENRWGMGLALASSMTTEKLNIGGGLSVSYRLSDRLSISSGLIVARVGVNGQGASPLRGPMMADNPIGPLGMTPPVNSAGGDHSGGKLEAAARPDATPTYHTRSLRSATSNLLTLDVPIDLKFKLNRSLYTAVGVSILGIVDEVRTHHYIDHINEPMFGYASSAGQDINRSVQATYVEEVAKVQPLQGTSYAGYLNFSVGHKTSLGRKLNLSVEPFFKLPVGRLSRADMNLTNGGIRIVTGF